MYVGRPPFMVKEPQEGKRRAYPRSGAPIGNPGERIAPSTQDGNQ